MHRHKRCPIFMCHLNKQLVLRCVAYKNAFVVNLACRRIHILPLACLGENASMQGAGCVHGKISARW